MSEDYQRRYRQLSAVKYTPNVTGGMRTQPMLVNGRKLRGTPKLWLPVERDERGGFVIDLRERVDALPVLSDETFFGSTRTMHYRGEPA